MCVCVKQVCKYKHAVYNLCYCDDAEGRQPCLPLIPPQKQAWDELAEPPSKPKQKTKILNSFTGLTPHSHSCHTACARAVVRQ